MDPRPTQVASGAFGDWRAQLQRQRMVYKIMDTLKKNLPFYRYDRVQELKKIAQRVEHETFTAATCESEYSRKICFMMLAMETRLQNCMRSNPVTLYNSVKPSVPLDSTANGGDWQEEVYQEITALKDLYLLDMIGQNPNGEDWQEEVYQKIKAMKDLYLPDLNYMHQKLLSKLQWHDAHPQQPENEQVEKMKRYINMLERFMRFLQVPKHGILAIYKDKLGTYEKAIIKIINSSMRKPVAPQQQAQSQALPPQHMQSLQQSQQSHFQFTQVQSHGNQMNLQRFMAQTWQSNKMPIQSSANMLPTQVQQSQPQLQQPVMPHMQSQPQLQQQQQVGMQQQPNLLQNNMQQRLPTTGGFQQQHVIDRQKQLFQQQRAMPEASSTSLDSTAGNTNGGDWQEEVYQKIKAMKDMYLLDLNDMHQKILSKLQQHDSLPQQPKNEQLEKLKVFKNMLERFMQFLQIPKHGILPNYKEKLGTYEKQIINVINSNRRKPAAPQQQAQSQALPPQHMQSLQQSQQTHSQLTQVPSHDNNQMNLHGSMATMQQNNIGNLQQNPAVSLSGGSNAQQMHSIQPSSNLDPGQNTGMNSLQHVSNGSLQQNTVSGTQQVNMNPMSLQANSNMLQNQHIKQQEQLLQSQQVGMQQWCLQQQYVIDMQKQLLQKQRAMPEASNSTAQTELMHETPALP